MSKVVVMKLLTGEEVIAKLVGDVAFDAAVTGVDNVQEFTVRDAKCMMLQGAGQQMGMTMIPYMLAAIEGEVKVKTTSVISWITEDKLPKQLLDAYLSQTSGIQIQQRL